MDADDIPPWGELLDAVRSGLLLDVESFGYRRSLAFQSDLDLVPREDNARYTDELLDLTLLLLYWQERFAGREAWDYDALERLAEVMEANAVDWAARRPRLSAAMREFAAAAWTVL